MNNIENLSPVSTDVIGEIASIGDIGVSVSQMDADLPPVASAPNPMCPIADPGDEIAVCGDWHGNLSRACDAVYEMSGQGIRTAVHVGDFMFRYDGAYARALDRLQSVLADEGVTLLFIDGNHDDHDFLDTRGRETGFATIRQNIHHVRRATTWTWRGKTWLGLGGAGSIDWHMRLEGDSWWSDEIVTPGQVWRCAGTLNGETPDVIVTHERPARSPRVVPYRSFGAQTDAWISGTPELLDALPDPLLWMFGHYHVRASHQDAGVRFEALASDGEQLGENVVVVNTDTLRVRPLVRAS